MIRLVEFEHVLHVDADRELKKDIIRQCLYDAQRTQRYAKFYAGRWYISVAFNRDYTIQLSSNYTFDANFSRELRRMEAKKYTLYTMTYFIWYWINKFRKL